jgi:hypothetical protein
LRQPGQILAVHILRVDDDAELRLLPGELLRRERFTVDFRALRRFTSICWMAAISAWRFCLDYCLSGWTVRRVRPPLYGVTMARVSLNAPNTPKPPSRFHR